MIDWISIAEANGINVRTFRSRVNQYGWSPEKAATKPVSLRSDSKWIKIAAKNGISREVYCHRVDEMLWSPEEASNTPVMSRKEASALANAAKEEYREITSERIFNDEKNMFKLTPQHLEIAKQKGIKRNTVRARVYNLGWTVQDAITIPIMEPSFERPEGYYEYREKAKKNGIKARTYGERVKRGWSLEDAATRKPSLSHPTRPDRKWMALAEKNGIKRVTYMSRTRLGWTPEEAATTPVLKKGEYLSEHTRENATNAFKKFRKR